MADIFLSYGGAQRLVEAFEKSLSRQGHIVYSDADFDYRSDAIIAKLRQFDAIIVIWSENSKSRDLTLAVAAEALRLGRLIQTRAPGLFVRLTRRRRCATLKTRFREGYDRLHTLTHSM